MSALKMKVIYKISFSHQKHKREKTNSVINPAKQPKRNQAAKSTLKQTSAGTTTKAASLQLSNVKLF